MIPILDGLRRIADDYDGMIIDLWGVIHDGAAAYPGAAEALMQLRDRGKRVVLLSNSPRRAETLVTMMQGFGIPRDLYHAVMSSGEAVHAELLTRRDPRFAALGRRCYHVGPPRDLHLFDGLDLDRVTGLEEAEFLLNTGPDDVEDSMADFQPMLDRAAGLGLKMICANPDLVVMHQGREMLCAGALAAYYQQIGGEVVYRGKPDPAIYKICFNLLDLPERRILAIGDAFHTDMAGAAATGIDGLFCSGGIHAEELGTQYGDKPDPGRLAALAARFPECHPVAAIGGLVW